MHILISTLTVKISRSLLIAIAFLIFIMVSGLVVTAFNFEILDQESSIQSDYLIDGYYYLYLGRQAVQISHTDGTSLIDAVVAISPSPSSAGVVFLASVLVSIVRLKWLIPLISSLFIFVPIAIFYRSGRSTAMLLGLPFCGLIPYFSVPSKELFLIVGLIAVAIAVTNRRYTVLGCVGAMAIYLGRPEAFYILLICAVAWKTAQTRIGVVFGIASVTAGYVFFVRATAREASTLFQSLMELADLSFCSLGFLNVCVDSQSILEWTYFLRLLSLTLLPLKWIADVIATFFDSSLLATEIIIRWANLVHILWLYFTIRYSPTVTGKTRMLRQLLITFAAVYWCIYGSIFYFQPTRQAILASTFLGLAFALRDGKREKFVEIINMRYPQSTMLANR